MELWNLGNKLILLLFVVVAAYFRTADPSPWFVVFFLIYVALNLIEPLLKPIYLKRAAVITLIAYLLFCTFYVQSDFVLLLALSLYELASAYFRKRIPVLVVMAVPLLIIDQQNLFPLYAFIALLVFFNGNYAHRYTNKILRQDQQLDKMRNDQEKLTKRLHENQEFIRASEYTYKLEERNRLSQVLHDGVGHSMTGALIQMEAAKVMLRSDLGAAETLLQNAIGISKEAIEQIRLTLKNIKPPVQQLGIHRLKAGVEAFGSKSGLRTTVVHDGEMERITPLQWKIIQDNVTEALTNTAKYASASAVHVEVRVLGKLIKAVVSDDGRGEAKIVKGLGLLGMEERTAAVNGTIIADGTRGFSVTTLMPLEDA
ncbi:signal transduction histidine kinase [Fontibacillus phaseoli]|uniref:histidine kinase n=1 Tax=Fontibacillus phaseoli TaxID=1416533 RepID=A0A369BNV5_9BACL|nr:histidine kinase [Fontibacillus phaseoli]RCX22765.1 signal transduction histidine kinase [Fontibacillus phaseoli]